MLNSSTYTTLETPSGSGELRVSGAHLAKVFYHLQVRQARVTGVVPSVPATLDITGTVTVSQDEPMQAQVLRRVGAGELLTLHLVDGRRLDVYATHDGAYAETFRIVSGQPTGFSAD